MGIYRFCKYRVGFDTDAIRRLKNLRKRLEAAADTLHPRWRQLLTIVGESQVHHFPGHPHDWGITEDGSEPVPLQRTYLKQDPYFSFEHIEESIVGDSIWGCDNPRWLPQRDAIAQAYATFVRALCNQQQSDDSRVKACFCFPSLFGCVKRRAPPVQIFRAREGKNNGLVALTSFDRGVLLVKLSV